MTAHGATPARATALRALHDASERASFDRTRVVPALDALAEQEHDDVVADAVRAVAQQMLDGVFNERRHADVLERCIRLLSRSDDRRSLDLYRAAAALRLPSPRGDAACVVRALALTALHALEPHEARFIAARLLTGEQSLSGEPAHTALGILGAASDDVAITLACHTVLSDELPLRIAALQQLSADVPPQAFWDAATPVMGDRFPDAVLAITDIIVEGRRAVLLPGLARVLPEISDPDLVRAVLLAVVSAHLDGVTEVFAATVERSPRRALPGIEEALALARIPQRDALLQRIAERHRQPPEAKPPPRRPA